MIWSNMNKNEKISILIILVLLFTFLSVAFLKSNFRTSPNKTELSLKYFCDFELLTPESMDTSNYVYVDKNTDVIYITDYARCYFSPIMKADGTCLTYTEWKKRGGDTK